MSQLEPDIADVPEDCAICLSPLTPSTNCLTLNCGHIYHKACILEQIAHSKPDPSHRLIFTGCLCAKCKAVCDHPELQTVTSHSKQLLAKVDAIIAELHPSHRENITEARRKYAFYLCSVCKDPFFGGTVQCAEVSSRHDIPANERVCETCSFNSLNTICTDASHAPYHVWKCRLCCNPSKRVCFGRTHFCDDCHAKFSIDNAVPPVPCPGRPTCPHPLPHGAERHANGVHVDCEQLLFCALCRSAPGGIPEDTVRYSRNLLYNPSGEHGTNGWAHGFWCSCPWETERSEVPFAPFQHNFVSSFRTSEMAQAVDLSRFVRVLNDELTVCISARYRARTDCPSIFQMKASLFDDNFNEVAHRKTDILDAPADCWEIVRISLPLRGTRARFAVIAVKGKDKLFWRGPFGSKVTDCRVRIVLGDQDEDAMLTDAVVVRMDDACIRAAHAFRRQRRIRMHEEEILHRASGFI